MNDEVPERRSHQRFSSELEGWIAHGSIHPPVPCTVRDLSESGMRLIISSSTDIPLNFKLMIPEHSAAAMVRLVWTDGTHYGAKFTD